MLKWKTWRFFPGKKRKRPFFNRKERESKIESPEVCKSSCIQKKRWKRKFYSRSMGRSFFGISAHGTEFYPLAHGCTKTQFMRFMFHNKKKFIRGISFTFPLMLTHFHFLFEGRSLYEKRLDFIFCSKYKYRMKDGNLASVKGDKIIFHMACVTDCWI